MPLSELKIRALLREGKPVAGVADGNGLTFRITPKGTACWVVRYRIGGRQKSLYLGQYPEIPLAEARKLALSARGRVMQGEDVARTKQQEKGERAKADTVEALANEYAEKVLDREYKHPDPWRKLIARNILPALGKLKVREVTDRDIIVCLDKVADRGARAEANHTLRVLKRMFRYGKSRRYLDRSPAMEIGTDAAGGREKSRERALSRDELGAFLRGIQAADINEADRHGVRLLILTMVRVSELAQARWEHVDLEAAEWTIPAEHSKNGKAYVVPLPPAAVEAFQAMKPLSGTSAWVLPSRRREGLPHINQETLNRAQRKARPESVAPFTVHDLRRTGRTHLAGLGVPSEVAERCLNHTLPGVEGIYNRHDYLLERRLALKRYAELVATLEASAGDVVALADLRKPAKK
jgi:integrase